MKPQEMTLDELRDWCAADDGWELFDKWRRHFIKNGKWRNSHPHPPTLEGAAKAMPEGWEWWKVTAEWAAQAAHTPMIRTPDTGDEITDRFRLAVLCRMYLMAAKEP